MRVTANKIILFASGRGSNVEAILKAIENQQLTAQVVGLVTNNVDAPVIQIAKKYDIPVLSIPHNGLSRHEHEEKILAAIAPYEPDWIVLAGYMRLFSSYFISAMGSHRIVNIHPSLLPDFPGAHAYEDAFAAGVQTAGVTVHFVDEQMDHGPIIAQERFQRLPEDTLESFKERGLAIEHVLYPQTLQRLIHHEIRYEDLMASTKGDASVVVTH